MTYPIAEVVAADHRRALAQEARLSRLARFVNRCCRRIAGC